MRGYNLELYRALGALGVMFEGNGHNLADGCQNLDFAKVSGKLG